MKNLNCANCGAPVIPDISAMTARCRYCGTSYVLNHEDTDYFQTFFRKMGHLFSGSADEADRKKRADALWKNADTKIFECTDGSCVEIRYLYQYRSGDVEVYVARRNLVFRFTKNWADKSDCFRRNVSRLDYPSADTRRLSDFFPRIIGGYALTDGTGILVIAKHENEYPLCLFGKLSGRHTAWIISRLENLCCVLEYNHLVHPLIGTDTVYINPYTHQASLYVGFWDVAVHNSLSSEGKSLLQTRQNLTALRNTAANLLGYARAGDVRADDNVPQALAEFINRPPEGNAYDDFALWDEMLIKAYGERRFVTMETDEEQIYGKGG